MSEMFEDTTLHSPATKDKVSKSAKARGRLITTISRPYGSNKSKSKPTTHTRKKRKRCLRTLSAAK